MADMTTNQQADTSRGERPARNARKVRRLGKGDVIAGFAGATADAFTLLERLEEKLEQYPDQLMRAAVELAKVLTRERLSR